MVGYAKDMILKGIVACGEWPAEARGVLLLNVDFNAEGTELTEVGEEGQEKPVAIKRKDGRRAEHGKW